MSEDKKEVVMVGGIKSTNEFSTKKGSQTMGEWVKERQRKRKPKKEEPIDKQQEAEETAHKPLAEPVPKIERPLTLTLGEASGVYYGSRDLWVKLFERFGLSKGKLTIKSLEFENSTSSDAAHGEDDNCQSVDSRKS